jgi:hypothetical protein
LRDVVSAADSPISAEFSGKRLVGTIPVPESTLRLSFGRAVLEEMLLLEQCSENRLGESQQCDGAGLCSGCGEKGKAVQYGDLPSSTIRRQSELCRKVD